MEKRETTEKIFESAQENKQEPPEMRTTEKNVLYKNVLLPFTNDYPGCYEPGLLLSPISSPIHVFS